MLLLGAVALKGYSSLLFRRYNAASLDVYTYYEVRNTLQYADNSDLFKTCIDKKASDKNSLYWNILHGNVNNLTQC